MFDHAAVFKKMRSGFDMEPIANLSDVPPGLEAIHITKATLNLELLCNLKNLRFLSAHAITDKCLKQICLAPQITHLSANAYGIKDLQPLSNLINLQGLELTDNTKANSINWLSSLTALQVFALADCPVTIDIAPITACTSMRYIWLSSSHTKPIRITSLDPLSALSQLECLIIKNARVADRKLSGLHLLQKLATIELPDFFPKEEFLALGDALPNAKGYWLDIHKQIDQ